ncbi:hypothetical protein HYV56_02250 [Candidatus Peregrinibacteria bacterium]|nr:hypothetical protein [Candidatus Peregrinibacteria bacterium]
MPSRKKQNKIAFQKTFKLAQDEEIPLMALFVDYYPIEKIEDLPILIEGLLTLEVEMAILEPKIELIKKALKKIKIDSKKILFVKEAVMERLFEASDIVLFLAETRQHLLPLQSALKSKAIPIILESNASGLTNYDPKREVGNSFLFEKFTNWHIFAAIVKALENYRFPYDWKNIVQG